jgi:hypothetical protein
MKKFAFFSDLFFAFLTGGLFSLCLFRFLRVAVFPALLLAGVCGALTALSVGAILQARRKRFFLKRSDELQKEKLLLHLALLSDKAKTQFFLDFLSKQTDEPTEPPALQRLGNLRIYSKQVFYFLNFRLTPVNADDIAKYARLKTEKKKILLCSQIEEKAFSLCRKWNIDVWTGEDVYLTLKRGNGLPDSYLGDTTGKVQRPRLKLWFAKTNARRFLVSAAFILFASLLTPYFYYYVFIGGSLLVVAIFVRIFGYE